MMHDIIYNILVQLFALCVHLRPGFACRRQHSGMQVTALALKLLTRLKEYSRLLKFSLNGTISLSACK
jgi:hypothetical protein